MIDKRPVTAFNEVLCKCECNCGIVRAGRGAKVYKDKFDFAIAHKRVDGKRIIKALVVPVWPFWLKWVFHIEPFTRAYVRACKDIMDALDEGMDWERHKDGS